MIPGMGDEAAVEPGPERWRGVLLSKIERVPVEWLWKPYLQRRAINLLSGDPGVGKSTLVCEIAAALSRGRPLPGQDALPPMNCWLMNGEDHANDTIAWRLGNQDADPNRIWVTDQPEAITADVAREICREMLARNIQFLSIDPLQSWMGKDVDMHRANETRAWGSPLRQIGAMTGAAVLISRHRRKGQSGDTSLYSGLGSIDISGFARSELGAARGKDGTTYIERIKGTVGKTGGKIAYQIDPHPDPRNDHGVLRWAGTPPGDARPAASTPAKLGHAIKWLKDWLATGAVPAQEVLAAAIALKISERTLNRAKEEAGVLSVKGEGGQWLWKLS